MSGEKTEQPTQQRLKKAKQEGQIGRTPDLGAWLGMLAASVLLPRTLTQAMQHAEEAIAKLPDTIQNPDPAKGLALLREGLFGAAWAVAPLALTMMAVGVAAAGAQGGIRVATKLFIPKFNRLNPFSGLKRMFGPHALWELTKSLFKTAVLAAVLYMTVKNIVPQLMSAGRLPLTALLGTVTNAVISLIRAAAVAGIAMAGADYLVVRRRTQKQLRMTKEEVKQENKNSEGDPLIKAQIRARQMAMARNRQMADVPTADVVVVNPVHVAVALRYEPEKGAPRVVAKGKGPVAAKIRQLATDNRVPMVQDIALARALNSGCEVGQEIPAEFFGAVARVLAFVMSLKARGSAAGLHRSPAMT
ncbi:type III secretion protein [Actinoplanes sp. SE50]|uniref:EscU/YscU/HrcU family type III secretion system export apparatus switch protein n=1 Tax=unclassified Actinoplanes TaxID=2626549 RepID=UPI00023EDEF3|nr:MULTISPECIES: EscU/YscU/HrcU family type III secretion system export apparatus switch protein [unclassified Actinoplanes]AEV88794.1 Flagellar biosynthetic protein flhB [Actinoplanes sp. SE50/110]ATO87200.1 type III secretion protein [Actinoplanes sp. SE50]SLM04618.1 type III secretion protein [Actinoplanes sp. SE50/110]